jgi:hypothetical protein
MPCLVNTYQAKNPENNYQIKTITEMSYHDVQLVVTDAIVTMLQANTRNIKTTITVLDGVTSADLKTMPKMGKRRYTFCMDAFHFSQLHPGILFANRSAVSYASVKANYDKLAPVFKEFTEAYRTFCTLMSVLGSNTLSHAFSTYTAITHPNNDGVQGIDYAREVLSAYFKGQGVQEEPAEEEGEGPFVPGNTPTDGSPVDGGDNG